jgi:hypothetical protein
LGRDLVDRVTHASCGHGPDVTKRRWLSSINGGGCGVPVVLYFYFYYFLFSKRKKEKEKEKENLSRPAHEKAPGIFRRT